MARKLNKAVVGITVSGCALAVLVAGTVVVRNLPGSDPTHYADDAEKYEHDEEFGKALVLYMRAHQKDPAKNPAYLVSAARCSLGLGEVGGALDLLQRALLLDTRQANAAKLIVETHEEIAELANTASQWKNVLDAAKRLSDIDGQSAIAQQALGEAYLNLVAEDPANAEAGVEALKRALELDPLDVKSCKLLARYYTDLAATRRREHREDAANEAAKRRDDVIARTVEKCAASGDKDKIAESSVIAAEFDLEKGGGNIQKGINALEALAATHPSNTDCYLVLGQYYASLDGPGDTKAANYEKAEQFFRRAIEASPAEGEGYILLSRLYPLMGKVDQVAPIYEQALDAIKFRKHFRSFRSNQFRAELMYRRAQLDLQAASTAKDKAQEEAFARCDSWIDKLKEEQGPEAMQVLLLQAMESNVRGELAQAVSLAEKADRRAGAAAIFELKLMLGQLYVRQREWGAARRALEQAVVLNPGNLQGYWLLGQVYLELDMPAETIRLLKPTTPLLRDALLNDKQCMQLRLAAYEKLKQYEYAEEENQRLAKAMGDDQGGRLRQAILLISEQKYKESEAILKELMQHDPVDEGVIRAAMFLYRTTGETEAARALVKDLAARYPDNRVFQQYALAYGGKEQPSDEAVEKFFEGEKDDLVKYLSLFNYYLGRNNMDKAKHNLDMAVAVKPDDPSLLERQFSLAVNMGDMGAAEKFAIQLTKVSNDGTEGKITMGRLAAAKGDTDRAISLIQAGLEAYPTYSMGHTYLGELLMNAGRIDEAKSQLSRAIDLDPTNGAANRLRAQIAVKENDEEAEEKYLTEAAQRLPNDSWVQSQQQLMNEKKNPKEGITARERTRRDHPDDVENLIRLARLYKVTKEFDKAADVYHEAVEASKTDKRFDLRQVTREVAWFMGDPEVNRPADGEAMLEGLLKQQTELSDKAMVCMFTARFYEEQKRISTSERYIRMAVTFDDSVPILLGAGEFFARTNRLSEALGFYGRAREKATDDKMSIHGRIISFLLAQQELEKARAEIDAYRKAFPDDSQGLIYEGTYHVLGGDIDKAEEAFQKELERHPDNPVALWQRGQLKVLKGDWASAAEDLGRAKALQPEGFNYQHRISLAQCLLSLRRGDEAVLELKSILDAHPDERPVATALAELYLRLEPPRYQEAENLIYTYMRMFPMDESWPLMLGRLGELTQNAEKAIEGYQKAVQASQSQAAIESLFGALRAFNRPQQLLDYANQLPERLLGLMPRALSALAWAYDRSGHREDALKTFDRALTAAGADFTSHAAVIGDMLKLLGKEAAKAQLENRDGEAIHNKKILLQMLYLSGERAEAKRIGETILIQATNDADKKFAHTGLAAISAEAHQLEAAKEHYEAVLKIDENDVFALNNLGFLLAEDMGNPAEALPYVERAARLMGRNADVLDTYGWVLAKLNRNGEAITQLLRAADADRQNIPAMVHLGLTYQKRGDRQAAISWLRRVQEVIAKLPKRQNGEAPAVAAPYQPMIQKALTELGA